MIVICEQCQTRFKLDETRIPPGGARVRCSRCKHAFFLPAPGSDEPDLLDELTSQTAASETSGHGVDDEPSRSRPKGAEAAHPPRPSGEEARESEWEFGEDLPGEEDAEELPDAAPQPLALDEGPPIEVAPSGLELASQAVETALPAEPPPAPPQPVADLPLAHPAEPIGEPGPEPGNDRAPEESPSLAEDASSWNFDEEEDEASAAPTFAPLARIELGPASTVEEPVQGEAPAAASPDLLEAPERVGRLLNAAGWLCTAVLFGLVLTSLLAPAGIRAPQQESAQTLGPLVAESLEGRFVDNLFAGPLLVVTARLRNPGDVEAALGAVPLAVLLDRESTPLSGARRPLAPVAERELRELPPESLSRRLSERGRSTALRAVPPGGSLSVGAVFPAVSPEAWGLAVELGPTVRPPTAAVAEAPSTEREP